MIVPLPSAVRVVVPEMLVLPMTMLPLVPEPAVKLSAPPVTVPEVLKMTPAAVPFIVTVALPKFEVVSVGAALVSVIEPLPEVALPLREAESVLEIVALPVPQLSERIPVETLVAATWLITPEPPAESVLVPLTMVLPTFILPLDAPVVARVKPAA